MSLIFVTFFDKDYIMLPAGTKAKTGEKCPQGGNWHPVGNPREERSIGIGNVMPPTPKGETHWVLKTPTGDK
jgi:hypothetical protein